MGKINLGRVLLGGIVAGLVINVIEGVMHGVILVDRDAEMLKRLGLPTAGSMNQIIALNVWGFVLGILTVWLYAAIRPRMGAGPKTAVCAGLFMWAAISLLGSAVPLIMGIYGMQLTTINLVFELVMCPLAAVAGAAIYKEEAAAQVSAPRA